MATTNINSSSNADVNSTSASPSTSTSAPTTPSCVDRSNIQSSVRSDSEPPAESENSAGVSVLLDVDPQIIEALKNKDRIYVLKLGEQMESLINDHRVRLDLTPTTSYQRLLVHRCSAYHKLQPEPDVLTKVITIVTTSESRIPARRICDLVPAESHALPTFKIMRRAQTDRTRSKPQSQAGSVAGDDADLSDVEPSETGSLGGRSNATGGSKKHLTIEQREAAYNEARSRIFMDFVEKNKEKDLSASSSSISLASASVMSAGGESSSIGDLDDSLSSPATESEWSGPVVQNKEGRRNGSNHHSGGSSSRGLRSSAPPFNSNGSSSTRESRASSPSFKYPSLYEPSPVTAPYEASQTTISSSGYVNSYLYTYPQPVPSPSQNYGQYPYYAPYPYPHPPGSVPNSDPASPVGPDIYTQPHHPIPHAGNNMYAQYPWPHPTTHQHPSVQPLVQHPHSHPSPQPHTAAQSSPAPLATQYSPYVPPITPYGPYPMPGYYHHPPMQQVPPAQMSGQASYPHDTRMMNGHNTTGNNETILHTRSYSGTSVGQPGVVKQRSAPPSRHAWSYGPGIGIGGYGVGNINNTCLTAGEVVGPRLSSMRRTSTNNIGNRTPAGDEASSTASSSTTSSSSRRTYTSTSSQHPLPARPDWAVGLKPQPTLHATHPRHHDSLTNSRTMSPARNSGHNVGVPQLPTSNVLQPTDFPPLTALSPGAEKRATPVGGAWTNSSSTRSILMPGSGTTSTGNALVNHSNTLVNSKDDSRLDDTERGFERPPPKGNVELFNPKGVWKTGANHPSPDKAEKEKLEKEKLRGEAVAHAILVDKVASMTVDDTDGTSATKSAPAAGALAT